MFTQYFSILKNNVRAAVVARKLYRARQAKTKWEKLEKSAKDELLTHVNRVGNFTFALNETTDLKVKLVKVESSRLNRKELDAYLKFLGVPKTTTDFEVDSSYDRLEVDAVSVSVR